MWLGTKFVGLPHCIWTAGSNWTSQVWAILQRLSSELDRPIFVLDEALTALLEGSDHQAVLASIRTCCLKGSTDANGFTAAPLPFPTDIEMLLHEVLPVHLRMHGVDCHEDAFEYEQAYDMKPHEYRFSEPVPSASMHLIACYEAIAAAVPAFRRR